MIPMNMRRVSQGLDSMKSVSEKKKWNYILCSFICMGLLVRLAALVQFDFGMTNGDVCCAGFIAFFNVASDRSVLSRPETIRDVALILFGLCLCAPRTASSCSTFGVAFNGRNVFNDAFSFLLFCPAFR
jgi:hypothetical protein